MIRRAAVLLMLLAACTPPQRREEMSTEIQVVAILPVVNRCGAAGFDQAAFGDALAAEFVKHGFRVLRPRDLEPLESALRTRADALVACALTDFDPYDPPRVGLAVQMLRSSARSMSSVDVDRLVSSASWHAGPYELQRGHAANVLALFEDIADARDRRTRGEIATYAQSRVSDFNGEREILAVQSRYLQFVANRIVRRLLGTSHGT
jgi:hypothetical protein